MPHTLRDFDMRGDLKIEHVKAVFEAELFTHEVLKRVNEKLDFLLKLLAKPESLPWPGSKP